MGTTINQRSIGQSIKSLRQLNNWTQEQLADKAFYSVRTIRRIENEGTTSIDVVNTFAEIFGVTAIDILEGDVFYFTFIRIIKNKKSNGDLRHTLLTLICYSCTFTLG